MSQPRDDFDFVISTGALRTFIESGTAALATLATGDLGMSGDLVPGDHAIHDDKQLMADLTALNGQISRYVLRHLDADAKRGVPTSPDDEDTLAHAMAALASRVLARANRPVSSGTPTAVEGDTALRRPAGKRPSDR
jgi:hypothetical protein